MPIDERLHDHDWLRQHYETDGLTIPEIARMAGVSQSAAWNALRRAGITCRRAGRRPGVGRVQPDEAQRRWLIHEYVERGRTLASIGVELGVTRERVRQMMAKHGIERRHRGWYYTGL